MNLEINVRKNDRVVVIAGKDRGKTGRVIEVLPRKHKLLVEGVNVIKRHNKANSRRGVQGGILEREAAIDVSNVMVLCPHCGGATRVGHQVLEDGKRHRACKKCGAAIEKQ
jgi:large subunit ribosomal protein L24